jgi:hypothetical protein
MAVKVVLLSSTSTGRKSMKCSTFLSVTGILGIAFGLGFLLAPESVAPLYGVPVEAHTIMMDRYFGGSLLWVGLISWLARGVRDDAALRALLQAGTVGNLAGLVVSAWSAIAGLMNALAWSSAALYALMLAGCLYLLGSPARRT